MTAAEGSFVGLALQADGSTENTTAADFRYMLFQQGSMSPRNVVLPTPPEIGGGALTRDVVKAAVSSGGALNLIPRPETLGFFLFGMTGSCTTTINYDDDGILNDHAIDGSTVNSGLGQPSAAAKVCIQASGAATGNITVSGTVSGAPDTEVLALNGATRVVGSKLFTAITSVELPTVGATTVDVGFADGTYTHVFKLDSSDHFSAPYYTIRNLPSINVATDDGEVYAGSRLNMMSLDWSAPGFINGTVSFVGGAPAISDSSAWSALTYVDSGPPLLTAPSDQIEVPASTGIDVIGGSFAAVSSIPLDEQYVVGQYGPQGLDIVTRAFMLQLAVKLTDSTLYKKMMYDPAAGSAWTANIFKEGNITLNLKSAQDAVTIYKAGTSVVNRPYSVAIQANGQAGSSGNVAWSMEPIGYRAQRHIIGAVTGTFLASPNSAYDPITITLVNRRASYALPS